MKVSEKRVANHLYQQAVRLFEVPLRISFFTQQSHKTLLLEDSTGTD